MATKKQRRRRAKEQRHDYVWVDAEGNELDPEEATAAEKRAPQTRASTPRRDPQAPSWRRTFKRGAIFAPIMLATVFLLSPDLPLSQKLTQTLLIVAIFVPFSYFLDRFFYRSFQRRAERREQSNGRRGS
jgi:ferric-dicitrate binding protein FerR (iron transport regulator)